MQKQTQKQTQKQMQKQMQSQVHQSDDGQSQCPRWDDRRSQRHQSVDQRNEAEFYPFASREFAGANFGDIRRKHRASLILTGLISNLGAALSNICGRNGAQLVCNFFKRKEVTVKSVLESTVAETAKRCGKYDLVYAVQDSSSLNYGTHYALEGMGPLSSSPRNQGLMMHTVLAVSPDGAPQGLLDLNLWARDADFFGKGKDARSVPVEEKESFKWIRGLERTEAALPPEQRVWVIGDRECDFYPIFAHKRRPATQLLVRNCYNRNIIDDESRNIEEALAKAPVLGIQELEIKSRIKEDGDDEDNSKNKGKDKKPDKGPGKQRKRKAKLALKCAAIKLKRPSHLSARKYPDFVEVYCVSACEVDAPADVKEPLNWTLLSTVEVSDYDGACRMLKAYGHRWIIEDFHKVLKSGCRVEKIQVETKDSLLPAIALMCVAACRVLYLSRIGREFPNLPVSEVADDEERMVLEAWISVHGGRKFRNYQIKTAQDFILCIAIAGGFKARKCDGFPGAQTLWQGLRRLTDLVLGFRLAERLRSR